MSAKERSKKYWNYQKRITVKISTGAQNSQCLRQEVKKYI